MNTLAKVLLGGEDAKPPPEALATRSAWRKSPIPILSRAGGTLASALPSEGIYALVNYALVNYALVNYALVNYALATTNAPALCRSPSFSRYAGNKPCRPNACVNYEH